MMNEDSIRNLEKQIVDERARLSADRMDISFGELVNLYKNNELIIRPEYQRLFRWNNAQKTGLIESILLGIPIPPIFVAEDEDGIWELVDGLQRVTTIISFFGELDNTISNDGKNLTIVDDYENEEEVYDYLNKWVLEKGDLIPELEGFNCDTLPKKYIINIKRAVCRVEILRGESNIAMKYELFKRLNSGGSKLTAQEIRNAIYRGLNPMLNEMLERMASNEDFIKLTGLSETKRKELYDQELILRFIAFFNNAENINSNTETFLDKFMEKCVNDDNFDYESFEKIFTDVLSLLVALEDMSLFKNDRNTFVPALYEGILIGVAQNYELYKDNKSMLIDRINMLKNDGEFKSFSGSASNSKNRIKRRLTRANEIFSNVGVC